MKKTTVSRYAVPLIAAALLAACGGSQPIAPGAMPQARVIGQHAELGGSWMLPAANSNDLLYISNPNGNSNGNVAVFSYPQAILIGTLAIRANGLCLGSHNSVWILSGNTLLEYLHGGSKPIKTLTESSYSPVACAVARKSGNLAVAVNAETILVYSHNEKRVRRYPTSVRTGYCTYDDRDDLFVVGWTNDGASVLLELLNGGTRFTKINLDHNVNINMGIQWHVNYLAIGQIPPLSYYPSRIFHYKIDGGYGRKTGTTKWHGPADGFFIERGKIVLTELYDVWLGTYPRGRPIRQVNYNLFKVNGAVVSLAPRSS